VFSGQGPVPPGAYPPGSGAYPPPPAGYPPGPAASPTPPAKGRSNALLVVAIVVLLAAIGGGVAVLAKGGGSDGGQAADAEVSVDDEPPVTVDDSGGDQQVEASDELESTTTAPRTTTTAPTTTTTTVPSDVQGSVGLVQRWADALAAQDAPGANAVLLDPSLTDQDMVGYAGMDSAEIHYVFGDASRLRVASVAHEYLDSGPKTSVYCFDITVDLGLGRISVDSAGPGRSTRLDDWLDAGDPRVADGIAACG
jgi:hypothetical protein